MFEGDTSQWVRNPDVRLGAYVALPTALVLLLTGVAYRCVRLRRGRSPRTIRINTPQEGGAEKLAEEPSEDVGACATTSVTGHRQVTYSEWL